jgi:hypothetical protein
MEILVEISPLNTATGTRVLLRAASADDSRILSANGNRWWPAISRKPTLTHDWFDGDFTGAINTGSANFDMAMYGLKRQDSATAAYHWAAAPVTLYEIDPAVGTATVIFSGVVDSFTLENEKLSITAKVDTSAFDLNAMTLVYLGTGGIEGPIDLQNKVKPWVLGNPQGLEPVLIDAINSVYQINGYGPINGITALYERAASFGASFGDFATYAALVAAAIPAGQWGTCLAYGLLRLGAPAYGVITADVQGDKPGGTWLRKTGEIINRIATAAGVPGAKIDSASLTALDASVARNISIYLTEQATILAILQRLARPCNASTGISWLGKLFVVRTVIGTPGTTLDAQVRRRPPVLSCGEQSVSPPYWRIEMAGVRCWRVHTPTEIAFYSQLVDVGGYSAVSSYREGNIVTDQAARWVYVNPVATTGNAPPALPTIINSYWSLLSMPPNSFQIAYANGISLEGLKPAVGGVEPGDGLIPNSLMVNDATGWTFPVWATRTAALSSAPAAFAVRTTTGSTGSGSVFMPAASVTGGQTLYLSATGISSGTGGRSATMSVVEYNSAGTLLLTTPFSIAPATVDVQQRFDFSLILNVATAKAIIKYDVAAFAGGALEITAARCSYTQQGATTNVPRGAWAASTLYRIGDIVTYGGSGYICGAAHTSSAGTPPPNGNFSLLASAGVPGASSYTWIAYADSIDGAVNFTTGAPDNRAFIGIAANQTTPTEGTAASAYTWSAYKGPAAFGLVQSGAGLVASNRVFGGPATASWGTAGVYSSESYTGACALSFKFNQTSLYLMVGLNTDPTTDDSYTSIDYAIYGRTDGYTQIYESGVAGAVSSSPYTIDTVFSIIYDGQYVRYFVNGALAREVVAAAGLTFYLDSAFGQPGAGATIVSWNGSGKAGINGANGVDALQVTPSPAAIAVACSSIGVPSAGQLPKAIQFNVFKNAANLTALATYAYTATNCTITDSGGGLISLTNISAQDASVAVIATYGGQTGKAKTTLTKVRDGYAASGASGAANPTASYTATLVGSRTLGVGLMALLRSAFPNHTCRYRAPEHRTLSKPVASFIGRRPAAAPGFRWDRKLSAAPARALLILRRANPVTCRVARSTSSIRLRAQAAPQIGNLRRSRARPEGLRPMVPALWG